MTLTGKGIFSRNLSKKFLAKKEALLCKAEKVKQKLTSLVKGIISAY